MKTHVFFPQMGESIAEGTVSKWLKKIGDTVVRDEPLLEISTDKVDAEIPSPADGVLVAIHVPEGGTATVNSVVAVIQDDAAAGGDVLAMAPAVPTETQPPVPGPRPAAGPQAPSPDRAAPGPGSRPRVSAVARRIARDHQLDLHGIAATGGSGRVTKADVLRHLTGVTAPPAAAPRTTVVPMTVMRRKIADHMIASRKTSAHVHSVFEIDCSCVERYRQSHRNAYAASGVKLSVLPFVVKAAADALRAWPVLNSSLNGDTVAYHGDINVGIAVALDNGLIVPVIKQADRLPLLEISRAIGDLARRARGKQLKPDEVAGGTFTVTNPGNFGGSFATPIINQPQVAILELGTVEKRVVVINDSLAIRPMMNLTLGFDHRVIDGATADQFLASVKSALEAWDSGAKVENP